MLMAVDVATAELASVAIESSLYGFFLLLSIISLVGLTKYAEPAILPSHCRRTTVWSSISSGLGILKRPIFTGGLFLVAVVTGHWIIVIIRAFNAFVSAADPQAYYSDTSSATLLAKNTLLALSVVIGDSLIIYRMWIVWGREYRVVVFAIVSLIGTTACGTFTTYLFRTSPPGTIFLHGRLADWIIAHSILSTCTNLYCSILIAWKIWNQMQQASNFISVTGRPLSKALTLFVESTALYAIWQLLFTVLLFAHSNLQSTFVDSYPPVQGIAFMSINARIYLSTRTVPNSDQSSHFMAGLPSNTSRRPEQDEDFAMHPVQRIAVRIKVEQENLPTGKNSDIVDTTQSRPNSFV
ncbi:hypothetical protein PM082_020709 [Marasmius tenuissimus]|nr:hypothetical protein PM082_020709 [Marasmius tenuissimus]